MSRRLLLLALLAFVVAACGGGHAISAQRASSLVLQQGDLGRPFASFYDGPVSHLDTSGTPRSNPDRFGHEAGWISRYHRAGGPGTRGPLVVESRADVFHSSGGAKQDLTAYSELLQQVPGAKRQALAPPHVGDAAVAETFVQESATPIRYYEIAWRHGNASASVLVEGYDGAVRFADALALARRQERRLAAA